MHQDPKPVRRRFGLGAFISSVAFFMAIPIGARAVCTQANCDMYNFEVPVSIMNTSEFPGLTVTGGNIRTEGTTTSGTFIDFVISDATANFTTTRFGTIDGGDFVFQSVDDTYLNPVTKVIITREGRLGVGTTTPERSFHVSGSDGMRLSPTPLPTSPAAGDIVVDSSSGNVLKYYNGANWVTPEAGGGGGSGTVTSIATGTGLTGGPITSSGTISIAAGGVGTTEIADGAVSDPKIDSVSASKIASSSGAYLTYAPNNISCAAGAVLKWQNSRWECGTDDSAEVPVFQKGDLLTHDGTSIVRLPSGANAMVLRTDTSHPSGLSWAQPIATDLVSMFSTGIVQKTGPGFYQAVYVLPPLSHSGNILSLDTSTGSAALINGGNPLSEPMMIGQMYANELSLVTDSQSRLTVTADGNVGIGTSAPARLFHVNGTMKLEPSSLPSSPETGDIVIDSDDANKFKYYDGTTWHEAGSTATSLWIDNSGSIAYTNGNVGIGTTSPQRMLHIEGPIRISPTTLPLSPDTGDIAIDSSDGNRLKYYDGTAWVAGGGAGSNGGANSSLSNLTATAINTDLLPQFHTGPQIGSWDYAWASVNATVLNAVDSSINSASLQIHAGLETAPDGTLINAAIEAPYNHSHYLRSIGLYTANAMAEDSANTGDVIIATGHKYGGTGGSGNIKIYIGTSEFGTRGKFQIVDGSEGEPGQVWTSSDSSGTGEWAKPKSPPGTLCGWADSSTIVNCEGHDPTTSCPGGYTQRVTATATFCSAN